MLRVQEFHGKDVGHDVGFFRGVYLEVAIFGKMMPAKSPRVLRYHPIFEQTHSHPSPNLMVFSKMGPWSFGALLEKLLRHGRSAYKVL